MNHSSDNENRRPRPWARGSAVKGALARGAVAGMSLAMALGNSPVLAVAEDAAAPKGASVSASLYSFDGAGAANALSNGGHVVGYNSDNEKDGPWVPSARTSFRNDASYSGLTAGATYTALVRVWDLDAAAFVDDVEESSYEVSGQQELLAPQVEFKAAEGGSGTVTVGGRFKDARALQGHRVVAYTYLFSGTDTKAEPVAKYEGAPASEDATMGFAKIVASATTASGDKDVPLAESASIKDSVSYAGLVPGAGYKLKGTLHYLDEREGTGDVLGPGEGDADEAKADLTLPNGLAVDLTGATVEDGTGSAKVLRVAYTASNPTDKALDNSTLALLLDASQDGQGLDRRDEAVAQTVEVGGSISGALLVTLSDASSPVTLSWHDSDDDGAKEIYAVSVDPSDPGKAFGQAGSGGEVAQFDAKLASGLGIDLSSAEVVEGKGADGKADGRRFLKLSYRVTNTSDEEAEDDSAAHISAAQGTSALSANERLADSGIEGPEAGALKAGESRETATYLELADDTTPVDVKVTDGDGQGAKELYKTTLRLDALEDAFKLPTTAPATPEQGGGEDDKKVTFVDGGEVKGADGKAITVETEFKAAEGGKGTQEVTLGLDATGLAGRRIVVFEELVADDGTTVARYGNVTSADGAVQLASIDGEVTGESGSKVMRSAADATATGKVSYENLTPGVEYTLTARLEETKTPEADEGDTDEAPKEETILDKVAAFFGLRASEGATDTLDWTLDGTGPKSAKVGDGAGELKPGSYWYVIDPEGEMTFSVRHADGTSEDRSHRAGAKATLSLEAKAGDEITVTGKGTFEAAPKEAGEQGGNDASDSSAIKDAAGKAVVATKKFTPEAANGTVEVAFALDSTNLGGKRLAMASELTRGSVTYARDAASADYADALTVPTAGSSLAGKAGEKELAAAEKVELEDSLSYKGLLAGTEYVATGTLVDPETGEAIKGVDGKEVTGTTKFTPSMETGTVKVPLTIDASALQGRKVGVTEVVTSGERQWVAQPDGASDDATVSFALDSSATKVTGELTDAADGGKETVADGHAKLTEKISYEGLAPDTEYSLSGILRLRDADGNDAGALTKGIADGSDGAQEGGGDGTQDPTSPDQGGDKEPAANAAIVVIDGEKNPAGTYTFVVEADSPTSFYVVRGGKVSADGTSVEGGRRVVSLALPEGKATTNPVTLEVGDIVAAEGTGKVSLTGKGTPAKAAPVATAETGTDDGAKEGDFVSGQLESGVEVKRTVGEAGVPEGLLTYTVDAKEDVKVAVWRGDRQLVDVTIPAGRKESSNIQLAKGDVISFKGAGSYDLRAATDDDAGQDGTLDEGAGEDGGKEDVATKLSEVWGDVPEGAVTSTATFRTPKAEAGKSTVSGTAELTFEFDAKGLEGRTIVAYGAVGKDDVVVAKAADIASDAQAVTTPAIAPTLAAKDGSKSLEPAKSDLVDTIRYSNLLPGQGYVAKSRLHVYGADGTDLGYLKADGTTTKAAPAATDGTTADEAATDEAEPKTDGAAADAGAAAQVAEEPNAEADGAGDEAGKIDATTPGSGSGAEQGTSEDGALEATAEFTTEDGDDPRASGQVEAAFPAADLSQVAGGKVVAETTLSRGGRTLVDQKGSEGSADQTVDVVAHGERPVDDELSGEGADDGNKTGNLAQTGTGILAGIAAGAGAIATAVGVAWRRHLGR